DPLGDLEDVIRIIEPSRKSHGFDGTVITIQRSALDEYMTLTDAAAIRTFDFTRFQPNHFNGWTHPANIKEVIDGKLFYNIVVEPGYASYMRGVQIVFSALSKTSIARHLNSGHHADKQYVSVIAFDFKNDVMREISCAPGATANYFTKSDLPFEMSP